MDLYTASYLCPRVHGKIATKNWGGRGSESLFIDHEKLRIYRNFWCHPLDWLWVEHTKHLYFSELDHEIEKLNKQQREHQNRLEAEKAKEREYTEKINEDVKDLEKMTNKQSLLLKKVTTF